MKYKLIASDMDGTLLNSKSELSAGNLEAIRKAMKAGIKFAVVSGRSVPALKKFDFMEELNTPLITYNGAKIYDDKAEKALYYEGLEVSDAIKLLKLAEEKHTTVCAWSDEKYYTNVLNEASEKYGRASGVEVNVYKDIEAFAQQGVTKIIWNDSPETVERFMKEIENEKFNSITYCRSNPRYLEFMNKKVSKAEALKKLGEIYNISREEIVAVGDAENDLSMISWAGLGVAMKNADECVKAQSGYITDTNDNDGVAKLIEYILALD